MASERDIQDVINTLIAEGIGEGPEGMRRIAETILNRAEQRGISPAEVVRQRAQYTGYSNPGPGAVQAMRDPNAITAAQAAWQMAQGPDDPTNGANHYWNPNIVNPSWAGSMQSLGQYGNHAFATDMPNWQRPAPRVAPTPLMASSALQGSRAVTSPSGGNTALQSALEQVATLERNRVTPASVEERVTARNRVTIAPTKNPALEQAARRAALTMNQSYAGQERTPKVTQLPRMSVPTVSASDMARGNSRPRTLPTATQLSNATGFRAPTSLQPVGSSNIASQRAEQLAMRSKPIGAQVPTTQQILNGTGFRGGPISTAPDRLTPGLATTIAPPAYTGNAAQAIRSPIGTGSITPVAVRPLPIAATSAKIAPVPFARPGNLMQAAVPAMAPVTAPRLSAPPIMAQARQPTTVVVRGSNTIIPAGPTAQQRVDFGNWATRNSGDTSSGSQAEAASARASGDGGRIRRY